MKLLLNFTLQDAHHLNTMLDRTGRDPVFARALRVTDRLAVCSDETVTLFEESIYPFFLRTAV